MGKAGNQLPEQPIINNSSGPFRCKTHATSWLTGPHPRIEDGKVARTVCFHWSALDCYGASVQIFVINCGFYFVYYLSPTSCLYRYCGSDGEQQAKVNCYANSMEFQLSRNAFNASKYESITLRDKNCYANISSNSSITLGSKLNSCGATRVETATQIVYTNEATLVVKRDSAMVTYDPDLVLAFSCAYNKDGYTNQTSYTPVSRITGNDTSIGAFTFELEMHKDQSFGVPYTSYPVTVNVNDKLYFQVKANVEDNGLVLLIDKCYSTPIMDRNDYRKYTFIENGCPTAGAVQFHSADRQRQRFSIQAFRYLSNHTTTYIHCLVLVCQNSSSDSRCVSGCSGNNVHRARREISARGKSYSEYYILDKGPIKLAGKGDSGDKAQSQAPLEATTIGLIVAVAALAIVVAVLVTWIKRKSSSNEYSMKEVGTDNFANGVAFVGK